MTHDLVSCRRVRHVGRHGRKRARSGVRPFGATGLLLLSALLLLQPTASAFAYANPLPVDLGTSGAFGVLAHETVTNTGDTVVSADPGVGGNLGVSPGSAVTGFPPGVVTPPGAIHAADSTAADAQTDAGTAYTNAEGRTPDQLLGTVFDLGGNTYTPGVYNGSSSLAITGTVTLDGGGDPDAVFIFQAGSTLVTSVSSQVLLTNGAQACNVFWQVGSSATVGATSTFNGTILALASVTVNDGATIEGRLLAGTGAVTLINDAIHTPDCAPSSGVPQAPLFGGWATAVAVAGFLGAGALVVRRRMRPSVIS